MDSRVPIIWFAKILYPSQPNGVLWPNAWMRSSGSYFQPLCAVYVKGCAPVIKDQLLRGDLKIANLYARMTVKRIPYEHFRVCDHRLVSFFNINTEDDLRCAQEGNFPNIV